jgi:uncharacterized protein YbcI
MADDDEGDIDSGGEMLSRLSNEMVRAQKKFFGMGPTEAKSYLVDDLLFIVMRGGMTTAEKTMLEFDQHDLVRQFRQTFENEMTERLTDMVEEITGRSVCTYQSQVMFDPDIVVEMFVFDAPAASEARAATGRAQIEDAGHGEATAEDALDTPSHSGQ